MTHHNKKGITLRKIITEKGWFAFLSFLCCVTIVFDSFAQVDDASLRAGWILALMQYTTWKEHDSDKKTICTIGRDSLAVVLRNLKQEKSLPIFVEEKSRESSLKGCQVVYVSDSESEQVRTILSNSRNLSILTVSAIKGFADMGGGVEFIMNGKKVSLLINIPAAKKAHIVIGADLLAIAKHID